MRYFIMLIVLFSGAAFANQTQEFKQHEKRYIKPSQISFERNSIFVQLDNQWMPVASLHVDVEGIFVVRDERETDPLHWRCPNCQFQNFIGDSKCKRCGWPG